MKIFFIVDHRAKLPGNRLLSDLSIRAYALEVGARVIDLSFLEGTPLVWLIDKLTRRTALWALGASKSLPPTSGSWEQLQKHGATYFFGWMFRNPVGLAKCRERLLEIYKAPARMQKKLVTLLAPLQGKRLIGVHLKLRPFKGFENGEFLVPPARVRGIVDEYLKERRLAASEAALVVVSDEPVPAGIFDGFSVVETRGNTRENLHLLARCEAVVGTNTTFSNLSAWFGNAPHVVTLITPIDWAYYKDKTGYFENKYATFAL